MVLSHLGILPGLSLHDSCLYGFPTEGEWDNLGWLLGDCGDVGAGVDDLVGGGAGLGQGEGRGGLLRLLLLWQEIAELKQQQLILQAWVSLNNTEY